MYGARPALGILGGMGPEASVFLLKTMNELSVQYFGASTNDGFPEIILDSVPVPDFISNPDAQEAALAMLKERVEALNRIELDCLSIACNTAHVLLLDLQAVSRVPFVSMIEAVTDTAQADGLKRVAILGTPSTIRLGLYHQALATRRVDAFTPDEEQIEATERVIRNVIAGKEGPRDTQVLAEMANGFVDRGAEGVILGCTELPLVFPLPYRVPVYNSARILGLALLRRYYGKPDVGVGRV